MGHAIIGEHSITCFRGPAPLASKLNSTFTDKTGKVWWSRLTKKQFSVLTDQDQVEAYSEKGVSMTRYLKGYLTFGKKLKADEAGVSDSDK